MGWQLNPAQREALAGGLLSMATGVSLTFLFHSADRRIIVLCGVVVAITLFLWRIKFRFVYGVLELCFGFLVLWDAAGKGRGSFSSDFSGDFTAFQLSVVLIQTFGAIYVLIRGMDNCLQGLPSETKTAFEAGIKQWHL